MKNGTCIYLLLSDGFRVFKPLPTVKSNQKVSPMQKRMLTIKLLVSFKGEIRKNALACLPIVGQFFFLKTHFHVRKILKHLKICPYFLLN